MWAVVQLRPQTHHPDQPAAHAAFQTHWARLVSNMGHRSLAPFARARQVPIFTTSKAIFPRRGSARGSHTGARGQFSFSDLAVVSYHSYWTYLTGFGRCIGPLGGPIYVKQHLPGMSGCKCGARRNASFWTKGCFLGIICGRTRHKRSLLANGFG
jgi:hypothetical protein